MKNIPFFVFFFLSLFTVAQESTDTTTSTDRIYWHDWYRLEWSDFEATPVEKENFAALSNIALPYRYTSDGEGVMDVKVQVCFLKDKSWYKEEHKSKVLLQHEQLHFDIAELHRRLIIKALLDADFNKHNYEELLKGIIAKYWLHDYREMQNKYDKETNYSRVIKGQIRWNKYVKQQLINLEEYRFTELEVSLISFD